MKWVLVSSPPNSTIEPNPEDGEDRSSRQDAMPISVVRRETRPDIPDAVGKNLEGDFWVIVFT
jgi:hypothetical protein